MSDDLTYPEEAMRQARARIEELEAEKREYAAKYMAAAGQAGDALERADAAEAKLREAVEVMRSAYDLLCEGKPNTAIEQLAFGLAAPERATLARLTGETQDGGDDE